jgi:uncharacterized protein YaeQ
VDRGVYETLKLRLARHPSESAEYLVTRLLAYCLEYTEGIAFSKGLSDPDEPAIVVRDLTGALRAWIEIGAPEAARLHKSAKAADRVAAYPTRDAAPWLARLERRMEFDLSVSEGMLYVGMGEETMTGGVETLALVQ